MTIRCLVVCEGSSDFSMIEGVMKHVASAHGKNIEAILLEPQYDAIVIQVLNHHVIPEILYRESIHRPSIKAFEGDDSIM